MDYKQKIEEIRYKLRTAQIDYDEAKKQAAPYIVKANEVAKEISKKYGMRHKPLTFTGIMR